MDHAEPQVALPEVLEYDEGQNPGVGYSEITHRISPDIEEPTLVEERSNVRGNNLW
jgi:hypothetical protein